MKILTALLMSVLLLAPLLSAADDLLITGFTMKPPLSAVIDPGTSIAVGLQMSLDLREGGSLIVKDSFNPSRTGTISSTATSWAICQNGTGVLQNGTNGGGFISLSPVLSNLTSPFTIEARINLTAINASAFNTVLTDSGGANGLWIHSGHIDLFNGLNHDGTATLAVGKWYDIAVTYAGGGAMTYYVNGVLDVALSDTPVSTVPARVLDFSGDGSEPFNGKMEYIRYWNRALSAQEVQSLYTNPYMVYIGTPNLTSRFLVSAPAGVAKVGHKVVQN